VPYHIAAGSDGALWFTEQDVNKIGRLEPSAVSTRAVTSPTQLDPVLTLAGSPQPCAALPNGLAVDHQGNIYMGEDKVGGVVHAPSIPAEPRLGPCADSAP